MQLTDSLSEMAKAMAALGETEKNYDEAKLTIGMAISSEALQGRDSVVIDGTHFIPHIGPLSDWLYDEGFWVVCDGDDHSISIYWTPYED